MCGIAGFYGLNDPTLLKRMTDVIRSRGPDGDGYFSDGKVALGMRRLSIIDLEGGQQPIFNEDKSICIVFNGEIYNFPSLRAELEDAGHRFTTNADTEAIVHAYEQWGDECVHRLRGMFAFAIWDMRRERLFLARDRIGIKPLHYALIDGAFFFASEIKSILENDCYQPRIDPHALHDYLSFLYVPAPRTIFKGISKLLPGHTLVVDKSGIELRQYWRVPLSKQPITNMSEAVNRTRVILEDAVKAHMLSDVPMGVYLSGGLDSSAIAAIMAKTSSAAPRTFTVGFQNATYDESGYARAVAEHIGADHQEMRVEADAFALLPAIVRQHDEPFGNSTSIINYVISREIAQHVKVAMSGAGGDEVFSGYPKYLAMRYAERYKLIPRPIRRALVEWPLRALPLGNRERDYVRWGRSFVNAVELPPAERYHALTTYMTEEEKRELYAPKLARAVGCHDSRSVTDAAFASADTTDIEQQVFFAEFQGFLPENILTYSDRTSMGASLEARVPLLDHILVEHAASIAPEVRMRRGKMKRVLKAAVGDLLPHEILHRRKMGFNPPTDEWIAHDGAWLVEKYLDRGFLESQGYFRNSEVSKMLEHHRRRHRSNGLRIWSLLVFEEWYARYIAGKADELEVAA